MTESCKSDCVSGIRLRAKTLRNSAQASIANSSLKCLFWAKRSKINWHVSTETCHLIDESLFDVSAHPNSPSDDIRCVFLQASREAAAISRLGVLGEARIVDADLCTMDAHWAALEDDFAQRVLDVQELAEQVLWTHLFVCSSKALTLTHFVFWGGG